jgi:hypothetical protein
MGVFVHSANADTRDAGLVELTGRVVDRKGKGVKFDWGAKSDWFPAANVRVEDLGRGQARALIPKWLAKKKGLIT